MTKYAGRNIVLKHDGSIVGQVTSLGNAGSSRDLIDASAHGDDWKDYVLGQQDGDDIEVEIAYDPASAAHASLVTAYETGSAVAEDFEMQHAESGFHVAVPALVQRLSRGGPRDGLLTLMLTLKIVEPGVTDIESS